MWRTSTPLRVLYALAATGLLCVFAYWRSLALPLISDDYLQIRLGREYGPVSGWAALAADPLYRCRATSLILTHWTDRLFGLNPLAFNVSSLLLHIVGTWLVLALGSWKWIGWPVAFAAACFFAVYEGHQEAVMWYAALPELLVFAFSMATLLLWRRRGAAYAAALCCFVLALLSKESAVGIVPVMAMAAWLDGEFSVRPLAPFAALSAAYFGMIWMARSGHYFFHDGTFSLGAPFWIVLPVSLGRMLWVCGIAAAAVLLWTRAREAGNLARIVAVWMPATLLPYCFLTYMPRVPSRHTYLASAGLALLVGAAFSKLRERRAGSRWAAGVAALVIVAECGYIWTRKQDQLLERAAPTERLLRMARKGDGVIRIRCFPYTHDVAESALAVHSLNQVRLVFDAEPRRPGNAADLCTN